jgi:hypothetical protein
MSLRTIKAKAAQATQLLAALKRKARTLQTSGPVLVVYGQGEGASIYYESEAPPDKGNRSRR